MINLLLWPQLPSSRSFFLSFLLPSYYSRRPNLFFFFFLLLLQARLNISQFKWLKTRRDWFYVVQKQMMRLVNVRNGRSGSCGCSCKHRANVCRAAAHTLCRMSYADVYGLTTKLKTVMSGYCTQYIIPTEHFPMLEPTQFAYWRFWATCNWSIDGFWGVLIGKCWVGW